MRILGYILFVLFIIYLISRIEKGPYIFYSGITHFIDIRDIKFQKKDRKITNYIIDRGDTIEFTNYDQIRHTVVNDEVHIPNSKILYQYDSYTHAFKKEGMYKFYSSLYKNMEPIYIKVSETKKKSKYYETFLRNLFEFIPSMIIKIVVNIISLIKFIIKMIGLSLGETVSKNIKFIVFFILIIYILKMIIY
jgi:plastocyanin